MGYVITFNDNSAPHTLYGTVGKDVYLGAGNLTGETLSDIISFPQIIEPSIIYPIGTQINQILGLVPLNPCTDNECRTYTESEYIAKVLADYTETDPYYNDISTFLIGFSAWYSLSYTTTIKLQEYTGGVWNDIATITDNTYGTYIPYDTYTSQPEVTGIVLSWHKILAVFNEGIYRVKTQIIGGHINGCAVSEPFCLKEYSCTNAMNTVKFEVTIDSGLIGNAVNPALLHDICTITYTDSIRFEGFFGYQKSEIEKKITEYNNGNMYKGRSESIRKYDLQTGRLPKWLHDRFEAYAFMGADTLLVSDYNYNNPDYNIKRKGVINDSGYEPVWVQNSRKARVKISFKENQQNLIRKRCCDAKR